MSLLTVFKLTLAEENLSHRKQSELFTHSKDVPEEHMTSLALLLLKKYPCLFVFKFRFILPNLLLEYDNCSILKNLSIPTVFEIETIEF